MSTTKLAKSARTTVDDVLTRGLTRELWKASYHKVLPITLGNFDLSAVLPMMFYMFRFGQRRGLGRFTQTFGSQDKSLSFRNRRKEATIEKIAQKLSTTGSFSGFDGSAEQAILGDLLLCFCLENVNKSRGRTEQVQRVSPSHYMASWIDLPESAHHLRDVPSLLVAMMANQKGRNVELSDESGETPFAVGRGMERNELLTAFNKGVTIKSGFGSVDSRTGDIFDESADVSIDQLLMIRLAGLLGEAPAKQQGGENEKISNQRPIARFAAETFETDLRKFILRYANRIPRHSFVNLLEACMAVGMTTIATSTIKIVCDWAETGKIPEPHEQSPIPLFVDCTSGSNLQLRLLSEQTMDDVLRRSETYSKVIVTMKLLDHFVSNSSQFHDQITYIETCPNASAWLNFLGDVLHGRVAHADRILDVIDMQANSLAANLGEDYSSTVDILRNSTAVANPVLRLAEALTSLKHGGATHGLIVKLIDSVLLSDKPNGISRKRSVSRRVGPRSIVQRRTVRSIIFSDSALDYLVHLHLSGPVDGQDRRISFKEFTKELRERHGLFVDQAPPGLTISNELLQLNRSKLERRLRDQGLLIGVNDAESMKTLRSRF